MAAVQEQRRRVETRGAASAWLIRSTRPSIASTRVSWIVSGSVDSRTNACRLSLAVTLTMPRPVTVSPGTVWSAIHRAARISTFISARPHTAGAIST